MVVSPKEWGDASGIREARMQYNKVKENVAVEVRLTWGSNSPHLLFTSYSISGKYISLLCDMFVHPSNTENQVV